MDQGWDNISDAAMHWAKTRPDAPALYEGHDTISWHMLADHVRAAAVELRGRGLREDHTIGLAIGNSSELAILLLAALRIGAIPAVMAPQMKPDARAHLVKKLEMAALFLEAEPDLRLAPITINLVPGWRPTPVGRDADARSARNADENRTAILSSGGTGDPRAHLSTQRQRMARAQGRLTAHVRHWSAERPGVLVTTSPLSTAMQQNSLFTQLMIGGAIAIGPPPGSPGHLVRVLAGWDGAVCILNPNQCRSLLRCAGVDGLLLPRAQLLRSGGEMLSAADKQALIRRVTPNYCESYGAAGTGTIALLQPEEVDAKAETVGRPMPGVEVQIVDASGNALAANKVGTIRVRGKATGTGFLSLADNDPAAPEAYRDGWVYPGDLGLLDGDGYLIIKGRASERIVQDGVEFYAAEVEAAILTLPGVTEAAVVARPVSGGSGEEAVAFVIKSADLAHPVVRAHCAARLTAAKAPRFIYYLDKMPKTAAGKIDKPTLRRFAAQRTGQKAATTPAKTG